MCPALAPLGDPGIQPQKGVDKVFSRTYTNAADRIEIDIPRNQVLQRALLKVEYDLVTTGSSLTGTLHTQGAANAIKKVTVKGNGDDEIIACSGPVLRLRSRSRIGEFPHQSGLASTIAATAGTVTAKVFLPIDFIDRRSTTQHATDFDPRTLSQFLMVVEMQPITGATAGNELYPNFGGTTPVMTVNNIRVTLYVEQVLNPIFGVHGAYETKFVRTGDIILTATDPENIYLAPNGVSLNRWFFLGLEETGSGTGFYQPSNSVISSWEFRSQNTVIQRWTEADRRNILEQDLTQIDGNATTDAEPTGLVMLAASPDDLELRQNIRIIDSSRTRFVSNLIKGTNGTRVQVHYEATKQIITTPTNQGA